MMEVGCALCLVVWSFLCMLSPAEGGSQTGVTGVIVGLVVGAILVVVLAAGLVLYCKYKRKKEEEQTRSCETTLWCLQKSQTSEGTNEEEQSVGEANASLHTEPE